MSVLRIDEPYLESRIDVLVASNEQKAYALGQEVCALHPLLLQLLEVAVYVLDDLLRRSAGDVEHLFKILM
jgi:hypothetical protein